MVILKAYVLFFVFSGFFLKIRTRSQLNILINNERRACLIDFGLTSVISGLSTANVSTLASNARGTCRWMAPELLSPENDGIYNCEPSTASDIYSLAMVAIEVM